MDKTLTLLPSQAKAFNAESPIVLFLAARSSGKSELGARWILKKCIENPGAIGAIIAPIYQQATTCVKKVQALLDTLGIENVYNRLPEFKLSHFPEHKKILSVNIPGSKYATQIYIFSADHYDGIRGTEFKFVHCDELREFKREAYETILPCLRGFGDDGYQQLLTTTTNGKDWIYNDFIESERSDVEIVRSLTSENVFNPPELITQLKEMMSERMYRQEVLNEILDSDLNAMFYAYGPHSLKHYDGDGRVFIASDQNVTPLTALLIKKTDGCSYVVDEIVLEEANLTQLSKEIFSRLDGVKTVYLTGDRSGNNRTWTGSASFYSQLIDTLHSIGVECVNQTNKVNPKVFNTTELVNREFEKGRLYIDPQCHVLRDQLEKVRWKKTAFEMDKAFYDGHATDCLRYYVAATDVPAVQEINFSYV